MKTLPEIIEGLDALFCDPHGDPVFSGSVGDRQEYIKLRQDLNDLQLETYTINPADDEQRAEALQDLQELALAAFTHDGDPDTLNQTEASLRAYIIQLAKKATRTIDDMFPGIPPGLSFFLSFEHETAKWTFGTTSQDVNIYIKAEHVGEGETPSKAIYNAMRATLDHAVAVKASAEGEKP